MLEALDTFLRSFPTNYLPKRQRQYADFKCVQIEITFLKHLVTFNPQQTAWKVVIITHSLLEFKEQH
jgi:hypothetical protein